MIRTISQLEDIMQGVIVRLLGWNLTTPDKTNDVRIGWQQTGAPAWEITSDMVFITATPVRDPISEQHDVIIKEGSPDIIISTGFTRVMELSVVVYGYRADEIAYNILLGMFRENPKLELQKENIFLLPNSDPPRRVPELFEGQWWERSDLSLRFNELVVDDQQFNSVKSVDVEVHDKDGLVTEFTVK